MKVTLVSVLPFKLEEFKPGLIPDLYIVPKAKKDDIAYLEIADGYHYQLIPMANERVPPLKVIDLGEIVASSLIQDFTGANLGVDYTPLENGAVPVPGLFYFEGIYKKDKDKTEEDIKKIIKSQHRAEIEKATLNTTAWFERLIKIADDDWSKYHQYRFITDYQRTACTWLGLQREWNFSVFEANNSLCWACKKVVNPSAIICACGAILDMDKYNANKDKFVKVGG